MGEIKRIIQPGTNYQTPKIKGETSKKTDTIKEKIESPSNSLTHPDIHSESSGSIETLGSRVSEEEEESLEPEDQKAQAIGKRSLLTADETKRKRFYSTEKQPVAKMEET